MCEKSSVFFLIQELTYAYDWLGLLWLTAKTEHATPPSQPDNFYSLGFHCCGITGIQTYNLWRRKANNSSARRLAFSPSNPKHEQLMSCQLTTRADNLCKKDLCFAVYSFYWYCNDASSDMSVAAHEIYHH